MLIRAVKNEEQAAYNNVVHHPLQTWEWGEFRKNTDVKVERLGFYDDGQLTKDRKSTRLNSSHSQQSRMPSSA